MQRLNPPVVGGIPLAGAYGPLAGRSDTVPNMANVFNQTPAADEVPETPEEVPDDEQELQPEVSGNVVRDEVGSDGPK